MIGENCSLFRLASVTRTVSVGLAALMLAPVLALLANAQAPAQKSDPYPTMAPVEQYLMDRDAEAALARTAAPEAISSQAKILVLGRHGYESVSEGSNGWVCMVERGWTSPNDFPEFWNPKLRGPLCLNPSAARSIVPITYKTTEMALAGYSKSEILAGVVAAFANHKLPPLEPGAMSYMMAKGAYLTDRDDHNLAHLMFYLPHTDPAAWGADVPNSPLMRGAQFKGSTIDILIVPVSKWSDGTPAPTD